MAPHDHAHGSPFAPSDSPGGQTPDAQSPDTRGKIAVAFAVTATILLAQAIGAALTGSLALLTDTVHMVIDASGLLMALVAATLVRRPPSSKRTWGYRRAEVLAALAQAAVLAGVGVYVVVEAVGRLRKPPDMPSKTLIVFGVVGLVGNAASMLALASARRSNLNMRAAFLEVANDALGSLSVIVAAVVIATTGWQRADAVAGLFIAALIGKSSIGVLKSALHILMEGTPAHIDHDRLLATLRAADGVIAVHDLHLWTITSGLNALSCHIVVAGEMRVRDAERIVQQLAHELTQHGIQHSTIQTESEAHGHSDSLVCVCEAEDAHEHHHH